MLVLVIHGGSKVMPTAILWLRGVQWIILVISWAIAVRVPMVRPWRLWYMATEFLGLIGRSVHVVGRVNHDLRVIVLLLWDMITWVVGWLLIERGTTQNVRILRGRWTAIHEAMLMVMMVRCFWEHLRGSWGGVLLLVLNLGTVLSKVLVLAFFLRNVMFSCLFAFFLLLFA